MEISIEDMQNRVNRFRRVLDISENISVEPISDQFFRIYF